MVEQIASSTVFRQFARSAGREIVRGHGGEISAEATPGEMVVTVRLPRAT